MTVSIGQYLPGNSIVHRADPRTKLSLTILFMVLVLITKSYIGYGVVLLYTVIAYASAKIRISYVLKSLKPVIFLVLFTVILNIFFHGGSTELFRWKFIVIYKEALIFASKMALRIILLVAGATIVTYTTTTVMLTDGIEALLKPLRFVGLPVHDIAMMMSIALRFIPIFSRETERIMMAQKARGSDFDSKHLVEKIKSFVPVLVPLFVSAWRRAEELANAMTSRCYRGGEGRTRFRVLKFTSADLVILIVSLIFTAAVILVRIFF